jgi:hypothetical protein
MSNTELGINKNLDNRAININDADGELISICIIEVNEMYWQAIAQTVISFLAIMVLFFVEGRNIAPFIAGNASEGSIVYAINILKMAFGAMFLYIFVFSAYFFVQAAKIKKELNLKPFKNIGF